MKSTLISFISLENILHNFTYINQNIILVFNITTPYATSLLLPTYKRDNFCFKAFY